MKTVKKDDKVRRVKDKAAVKMVANEGWQYCPKSEWKKVRQEQEQSDGRTE